MLSIRFFFKKHKFLKTPRTIYVVFIIINLKQYLASANAN